MRCKQIEKLYRTIRCCCCCCCHNFIFAIHLDMQSPLCFGWRFVWWIYAKSRICMHKVAWQNCALEKDSRKINSHDWETITSIAKAPIEFRSKFVRKLSLHKITLMSNVLAGQQHIAVFSFTLCSLYDGQWWTSKHTLTHTEPNTQNVCRSRTVIYFQW